MLQRYLISHCVRSVHNESFSGPYFPAFKQNTDYKNSSASCGVTILFFIFSKVRFSSILSFNIFSNEPQEISDIILRHVKRQLDHDMNRDVSWGYVSRNISPIIASNDGRSLSRNIALLNILVHNLIIVLYDEHWTDKWKYFYVRT